MQQPVTAIVSQPPSSNFSYTVMQRIVAQSRKPSRKSSAWRIQRGRSREPTHSFSIPNIESEKVTKTLMLYITTRRRTSPRA